MNTDSFRIDAQLVARNRAQAAISRPPEAGFSSALDQASRRLTDEDRRVETSPLAQADRGAALPPQARAAVDRDPGPRAEPDDPDAPRPGTPPAGHDEASKPALADSERAAHRAPTAQAAELKRLLKQFQDNKAVARTLQAPVAPDAPDAPADEAGLTAQGRATGPTPDPDLPSTTRSVPESAQTPPEPALPHRPPDLAPQERRGKNAATLPASAAHAGRPDQTPGEGAGLAGPAGPQTSKALRGHPGATGGQADSGASLGGALQQMQNTHGAGEPAAALTTESAGHPHAGPNEASNTQGMPAGLIPPNPAATPGVGAFSTSAASGTSPADAAQWRLPYTPGDLRFGEALGERLSWMIRDGLQQAEITLNPQELGPIRIALSMQGDAAQLGIQADHPFTRQIIEDALPRLKDLLAEQGVQLGQTQVGEGSARQAHAESRQGQGDGRARDPQTRAARGNDTPSPLGPDLRTGQVALRSPAAGRIDVFV